MTVEEIKKVLTANFSALTDAELSTYLQECNKLICNMVQLDPVVFELQDSLQKELTKRGK